VVSTLGGTVVGAVVVVGANVSSLPLFAMQPLQSIPRMDSIRIVRH